MKIPSPGWKSIDNEGGGNLMAHYAVDLHDEPRTGAKQNAAPEELTR
jgi:hypothetical protein